MKESLFRSSCAVIRCVVAVTLSLAPFLTEAKAGEVTSGLFDQRYCEILTIKRDGLKAHVTVFNTIGHNLCPDADWKALDPKAIKSDMGLDGVKMNGPRHWLVDGIEGQGVSATGNQATFGKITMSERATLELGLLQAKSGGTRYKPTEVKRETTWIFKAGAPVFELTDPDGKIYIMQSYAQIVDPALSVESLGTLGTRLKLPKGWHYANRILESEYRLVTTGTAYVIQDEYENTYQRRN